MNTPGVIGEIIFGGSRSLLSSKLFREDKQIAAVSGGETEAEEPSTV